MSELAVRRLLAIDVFAGAGGLTVGLKRAGFRVIGAIEINDLAVETYRINHPDVRIFADDIRQRSGKSICRSLRLKPGRLDLLAGCPPCEGFSSLRTRNGARRVRDPRNDLIFDFLRMVRVLRPKLVMMENVPALLHDRRMKLFLKVLEKRGYRCKTGVLDAADYRVPQRRRRLLLLASRLGQPTFASKARNKLCVRDAIARLKSAGKSGDPLHDLPEKRSKPIVDMIKLIPKNGGSRTDLPVRFRLKCHRICDGYKDVYGRMNFDGVAPTITSGCVNPSRGRFLHPTLNRSITLREAALLQGFPMRYFFSVRKGKFATAALIGNALPPEFAKRHALALLKTLPR